MPCSSEITSQNWNEWNTFCERVLQKHCTQLNLMTSNLRTNLVATLAGLEMDNFTHLFFFFSARKFAFNCRSVLAVDLILPNTSTHCDVCVTMTMSNKQPITSQRAKSTGKYRQRKELFAIFFFAPIIFPVFLVTELIIKMIEFVEASGFFTLHKH